MPATPIATEESRSFQWWEWKEIADKEKFVEITEPEGIGHKDLLFHGFELDEVV